MTGVACLSALVILPPLGKSLGEKEPPVIPSPRDTVLPTLTFQELEDLPYPPDALPGRRDVGSPHGE